MNLLDDLSKRRVVALFILLSFAVLGSKPARAAATFIVSSALDATDAAPGDGVCAAANGLCTLRAAIQEANALAGDDTILLPAGVYFLSIANPGGAAENAAASGDLDLTSDISLLGGGQGSTLIDGGALDRVFHVVGSSSDVAISSLTIRNGRLSAGNGGGIENGGNLNLTQVAVSANMAVLGGGISNNSVLTMSAGRVESNTANNDGGGFINNGVLTVVNTIIRGNISGDDGGGLRNLKTFSLTGSTLSSNSAASFGGGLANGSGSGITGTVTIANSLFNSNTSMDGGGGLQNELGTVVLINSTLSGNASNNNGGGIYNLATLNLHSATITGNTADSDSNDSGSGGGVRSDPAGTINFSNSLIVGNFDNSSGTKHADCSGALTSQNYNLIFDLSGCTITGTVTSNKTGVDPLLAPLQNNGGPTFTHALLAGSPAIDAGNPAGCRDNGGNLLSSDQRGLPRTVDGDGNGSAICDIGAYEFGNIVYWVYLPVILRSP
jgi:CSLREA domain-containing protein